MSIGLPAHLRPQSLGRAFVRGGHAIALVCLLATAVIVAAVQVDQPTLILWPAIVAILPILVVLRLLDQQRTLVLSVAYLVIGGASTYWFSLTVMSQYAPLRGSDTFVLSLMRVALLFVGGWGFGLLPGILWSVAGLAVAEIAIVASALQTSVTIVPDGTSLMALVVLVLTRLLLRSSQRSVLLVQPSLHRAARDEYLASMRYGIEARAAAVMHDTVLNHLAAIATARSGPVGGELRTQIERDLEILVGEEWLADSSPTLDVQARTDWQQSQLFLAVQECRRLGLEIELSGDIAAAGRLDPARSTALGLAVKQCLVNVIKHAGTDRAEVVVYGSESDVSVMVIDGGRGFTEGEASSDRLGLRQSVRRRMEAVGGEVQVWSAPGRGTSVMISVPAPVGGPT